MENRKGFSSALAVIVVLAIIALGGGAYYVYNSQDQSQLDGEGEMMEKDEMMEGEHMMEEDGESMMKENGEMMEEGTMEKTGESMMMEEESMMESKYSGTVLAGKESLLLDFNNEDYQKALKEEKLVALYFYANWCPICKAEFPKMQSAFNKLSNPDVVGFRVNYNDTETDDAEKSLAKEFGVAYQHTKVILKDGTRVLKSPETWEEGRYISEINNLLS